MKKAYTSPKVESKGDLRSATQGNPGQGSSDTFMIGRYGPFDTPGLS